MFVRLPGQTRDKNVEVSVAVPTVEVRGEEYGDTEHTNIKTRYDTTFIGIQIYPGGGFV